MSETKATLLLGLCIVIFFALADVAPEHPENTGFIHGIVRKTSSTYHEDGTVKQHLVVFTDGSALGFQNKIPMEIDNKYIKLYYQRLPWSAGNVVVAVEVDGEKTYLNQDE